MFFGVLGPYRSSVIADPLYAHPTTCSTQIATVQANNTYVRLNMLELQLELPTAILSDLQLVHLEVQPLLRLQLLACPLLCPSTIAIILSTLRMDDSNTNGTFRTRQANVISSWTR